MSDLFLSFDTSELSFRELIEEQNLKFTPFLMFQKYGIKIDAPLHSDVKITNLINVFTSVPYEINFNNESKKYDITSMDKENKNLNNGLYLGFYGQIYITFFYILDDFDLDGNKKQYILMYTNENKTEVNSIIPDESVIKPKFIDSYDVVLPKNLFDYGSEFVFKKLSNPMVKSQIQSIEIKSYDENKAFDILPYYDSFELVEYGNLNETVVDQNQYKIIRFGSSVGNVIFIDPSLVSYFSYLWGNDFDFRMKSYGSVVIEGKSDEEKLINATALFKDKIKNGIFFRSYINRNYIKVLYENGVKYPEIYLSNNDRVYVGGIRIGPDSLDFRYKQIIIKYFDDETGMLGEQNVELKLEIEDPSAPASSFADPSAPASSFAAPSAPASSFADPSASFAAPSASFAAPSAPASSFADPSASFAAPSASFAAPSAPSSSFADPSASFAAPSASFAAPSAPASSFAAPSDPSAPASSFAVPFGNISQVDPSINVLTPAPASSVSLFGDPFGNSSDVEMGDPVSPVTSGISRADPGYKLRFSPSISPSSNPSSFAASFLPSSSQPKPTPQGDLFDVKVASPTSVPSPVNVPIVPKLFRQSSFGKTFLNPSDPSK